MSNLQLTELSLAVWSVGRLYPFIAYSIACVPVTEHIKAHLYPILIHMEFPFINQIQFTVIFDFATGNTQ